MMIDNNGDSCSLSPGRGDSNVATGGAARRRSRPTRNPWFRWRATRIAPVGAKEVCTLDELLSSLRDWLLLKSSSTGCAAPEGGSLHPWLHSDAPTGAKQEVCINKCSQPIPSTRSYR